MRYDKKISFCRFYKEVAANVEDGKLCVLFLTHYLPCPSCQAKRDRLNEPYEQYKNNVEFVIVMDVCADSQMQERFLKNMKLLPEKVIITENMAQWMSLGVKTFPSFVLFDKKGNVFYGIFPKPSGLFFIQIHEPRLNSLRFFIDVV